MNQGVGTRASRTAKIAVVMGGRSAERDVSIQSGTRVLGALQTLGYDARSLDYDARFIDAIREGWPPLLSSLKTFLETGEALDFDM